MQLAAHGLGCSILTVNGMENGNFSLNVDDGWKLKQVDVMTEEGIKEAKAYLIRKDRAGLLMWVDTTSSDKANGGYFTKKDINDYKLKYCSGRKFYDALIARGEHVEKSASYKNPNHEGTCTLYWWYFRKKASATPTASGGSSKDSGREKVAKKTATPSSKLANKPPRTRKARAPKEK